MLALAIVVLGSILYVGGKAVFAGHQPVAVHAAVSGKIHPKVAVSGGTTQTLPKPPLSCNTNATAVPLTSDYLITDMGCVSSAVPRNGVVLICNGTLMQGASNVSMNCAPSGRTPGAGVVCSGSTNAASAPVNLALNYQCFASSAPTTDGIYVCSGDLANYGSLGISLPLSVSCGS